ncbi:efflux RND transporter periplasmic adaptor subunit [Amphritea sp. 1_MG-2023]|uniref:efflux RND transporter periplasmic adaptor subunit n=1 Tax=Amphritea sp. 1_MG-2023 TaxID=3062670 RepID=UPI0026E336BB|nr:efflux RND transporter periplasmic adaptor subunit [Amphritea sp. 1_MG-2023]MDO6563433.1 efflux RND transporter periplasmic adaptor subunit [Amphritea sp. 1_MG-2023]
MSANLFSSDWYQIAELKPRLRHHVTVNAHRYRGKRWYVLEDHVTGQVRRLSPQSYLIVGLMNGERTIDRLWELASQRLGEEMPTHEEMLQLLASLYQANLVGMDTSGDISELFERGKEAERTRWMSKLKSPLSIKIPLLDPERFLVATQHYIRPFISKAALCVWCLLVIGLLVMAGQHWDELTENVTDRVLAADNLVLLWFVYPVIKLIHELGHGYCVKRGGGEVHELGIMLLVLLPMPYVDASSTNAFADKKQRILVSSAGIIVELFIAAVAMFVWVNAAPGMVKSIAYNIIFIAGLSTVLVNGNPLLRFDGYYILADLIEIPNLGQRANQYWGWLSKRFMFGVGGLASPAYDRREALWLFFYGFASYIYRMFLMVTIVLFVAQQYFFVGIVLAIWALVGTLLVPNVKLLKKAWQDSDIRAGRRSPTLMIPLVAGIVALLLCVMPLPLNTSIEGVVQLDEQRRVLAEENCFVEQLHKRPGSNVVKGDLLISCSNPQLRTEQLVLQQQFLEASAERQGVWNDPVQLKIYDDQLSRLSLELKESEARMSALNIYAQADGLWSLRNAADLSGKFLQRGDLIGHVISNDNVSILGMVPEADIGLVRDKSVVVSALQTSDLNTLLTPQHWSVFPAATKEPVSGILTETAGGSVIMDPSSSSTEAPQSLRRYFIVALEFERFPIVFVEERIHLKFEHPPEAIIYRLYRVVRRTFLEYFDV